MPTAVPVTRRRRKEARPQEILAAALSLFVERGYAATRLEEVARRAGVAKGTLYLYYANKEALFRAVVEEGILPVLTDLETQAAGYEGDTPELLRRFTRQWWRTVGATDLIGLPKLVLCEARNFPELADYYFERVIRRGHGLLRRIILRGMERGEFRPVVAEQAVMLAISPLLIQSFWRAALPTEGMGLEDPEALLDTHVDIFLRGVLAETHPCA